MRRFIDEAFSSLVFSRATNENEFNDRLGVLDLISQMITMADGLLTSNAPWKLLKAGDETSKAASKRCALSSR